ncbi:helix-turn-helix transcriptional regulator [Paenibacillus allorhizosphaerae]|uniref:HTH-type transcriptional activator RhaR n=1 Tax=Paenibacillus allorhizosphaerae TaxID=2849866 RepID=A0ABM8VG31_9BACL|nr:AraC family transcriptional regulator [Paenibacillus allorhizosphaerae]CAG7637140.1 HTH-type transcriptional activator RhaR [Paenibacillus allorhizosphaerae]
MPDSPVVTSDDFEWSELKFSGWEGVSPQEAFEPELTGHLIVIHTTPQPVRVFERADGYHAEGVAMPGNINMFSAGDMSFCRWEKELSFLRLDLSTLLADKVAAELELPIGSGAVEFGRHIRLHDDRVVQIAQWLCEDLKHGGLGGKIYADSLIRMLTVHMLHRYGTVSARQAALPKALAKKQLDGALQYVHAYLEHEISLDDIAAAAHVSSSHLVRLFKEATGLPPHRYIIQERVRKAQRLLLSGLPVHEVAASLGFSDQSHFHRHFKRMLGVTPREFVVQFR